MLSRFASVFRVLSWIAVAIGFLHLSHVEFGIPPDKFPRPKPPIWRQRAEYLGIIGLGVPGATWGVVRAWRFQQKTPWQ